MQAAGSLYRTSRNIAEQVARTIKKKKRIVGSYTEELNQSSYLFAASISL